CVITTEGSACSSWTSQTRRLCGDISAERGESPLVTLRFSSNFARFLAAYFRGPRSFVSRVVCVRGKVGVARMKRLIVCIAALAALGGPAGAMPETFAPQTNASKSPFMRVYGPAQPPYGFVRFCERNPDACRARHIEDIRFQPTPERLSELDEVNRWVNHAV